MNEEKKVLSDEELLSMSGGYDITTTSLSIISPRYAVLPVDMVLRYGILPVDLTPRYAIMPADMTPRYAIMPNG